MPDETIRSYNKLGKASGSAKEMERERTKLREKMNALQKANGIKADQKPQNSCRQKIFASATVSACSA